MLAITSTYYTHVQLYELLEPLCAVLRSMGMQNVVLKASKHRFYMCTCSGEAVWLVNKSFPYRVRLIFPLLHFTVSASNMQVLFYLFLLKEASLNDIKEERLLDQTASLIFTEYTHKVTECSEAFTTTFYIPQCRE